MSKEATAAVASVLILLGLLMFAQLDPARGLSFRAARASAEMQQKSSTGDDRANVDTKTTSATESVPCGTIAPR